MTTNVAEEAGRCWDAIVVHADDDVAVALRDLRADDVVRVRRHSTVRNMRLREDVALGHKFALHAIAAGADVRKYGESIGISTAAIAEGAHVHVHNLASRRGRQR